MARGTPGHCDEGIERYAMFRAGGLRVNYGILRHLELQQDFLTGDSGPSHALGRDR